MLTLEMVEALKELKPLPKQIAELVDASKKSVSMSGVGYNTMNGFLSFYQLKRATADIDFDRFKMDCPNFYSWRMDDTGNLEHENTKGNKEGYMKYLTDFLFPNGFKNLSIHEVDKQKGLLITTPSATVKGLVLF
jgi:hypothetical protein